MTNVEEFNPEKLQAMAEDLLNWKDIDLSKIKAEKFYGDETFAHVVARVAN